ncbi:MAG: phosphate propanoyltransferase [Oscillospiraceae bacterium]|jgi:putative phosphotransacetylase|nr:phosphate propanoyltransferase [Oscillospiraceae bacterium]
MAKILVETSARHIHVTEEALEALFGKGATLTEKKRLSQPTEFVCDERVTVKGPKREIAGVSILGPCRAAVQVELSATDARSVGVKIDIRESGDVKGTPGCTLIGPAGELTIAEGVIVAKRHAHMTPKFAEENGLNNGDIIKLKIAGTGRAALLDDVVVRVRDSFTEAAHIDTDESNTLNLPVGYLAEIVK